MLAFLVRHELAAMGAVALAIGFMTALGVR
jgi:CBS-domain-containing membrane protein